jgi:hypothetical protein
MKVTDNTIDDDLRLSDVKVALGFNPVAEILIFYSAYSILILFFLAILLSFGVEIDLFPIISSIILSATGIAVASLFYVVATNDK